MLVKGTWNQAAFKPLNLDACGRAPSGGALHPLMKVRLRPRIRCSGRGRADNRRRPSPCAQVRSMFREIFLEMVSSAPMLDERSMSLHLAPTSCIGPAGLANAHAHATAMV